MSTAPALVPVTTVLAFRTPQGGVSIPAGQSKQLGTVDVATFEQIRVVADERAGSGSGINIRLTITEGNELVAQLDVLHLTPHSQVTRVYDVPGTKLTVFADAAGGTGSDGIDVLIYGSRG
jgi:type III secretion protein HrpB1